MGLTATLGHVSRKCCLLIRNRKQIRSFSVLLSRIRFSGRQPRIPLRFPSLPFPDATHMKPAAWVPLLPRASFPFPQLPRAIPRLPIYQYPITVLMLWMGRLLGPVRNRVLDKVKHVRLSVRYLVSFSPFSFLCFLFLSDPSAYSPAGGLSIWIQRLRRARGSFRLFSFAQLLRGFSMATDPGIPKVEAVAVGGGEAPSEGRRESDPPRLEQKKARKERVCTAKERISRMPPCAAGKRSSIYRGVTR